MKSETTDFVKGLARILFPNKLTSILVGLSAYGETSVEAVGLDSAEFANFLFSLTEIKA